jgi:N-acetylglucosamine-6-phosphate deacetylase
MVMAGYLAQNGVTSFLAASVTAPEEELMAACRAAAAFQKERPQGLSRLLGVMMEGPFLSEKYKRAHPGSLLQRPDEGSLTA